MWFLFVAKVKALEKLHGPIKIMNQENLFMSHAPADSKKLLSYTIADWACALKYEDLSLEAIQAVKLFWFDTIGVCAGRQPAG